MNDPDNFRWLVDSRSKIQSFLLQLYPLIGEPPPTSVARSAVLQLLLGSAFSLWRAVFLAEDDRKINMVENHAKEFLRILIKDNAINYTQDSATRNWTVGYYLNNAYFRLNLAYQALGVETNLSKSIKEFLLEQISSRTAFDPIQPWNNAHAAALEILETLSLTVEN